MRTPIIFLLQCACEARPKSNFPDKIEPSRKAMPFEKPSSQSLCRLTKPIKATQGGHVIPSPAFPNMPKVVFGIEFETSQYRWL